MEKDKLRKNQQDIINRIENMTERQKEILRDYLNDHLDEFHEHTIDTLIDGLKHTKEQYIIEIVTSKLNLLVDGTNPKVKKINDLLEHERGKAFVQSMSDSSQSNIESMQAKRDSRYEKMIEESEAMDVPTIGQRKVK